MKIGRIGATLVPTDCSVSLVVLQDIFQNPFLLRISFVLFIYSIGSSYNPSKGSLQFPKARTENSHIVS